MIEKLFEVLFLEESFEFLKSLDKKHSEKILYNVRKAQAKNDPELLKKLNSDIWEFRTLYQGHQYRLLAFWDKTCSEKTMVIATHGFVKKQSKVPDNEIGRALNLRDRYFQKQ
ncbi:type II toxin-antitoxin system RelE/ParE family toxin [Dyadobacter sp. CY323]|nr:type II toxin-antitoxin system RelE/ParE family toxin [Dyadobacter sp. CY323]